MSDVAAHDAGESRSGRLRIASVGYLNAAPLVRGLADVLKLRPILHGYTVESGLDQTKDDYAGFSAQNVQSVMPEAVGQMADGMLTLNDRAILAAVVNAIHELERRP